MPSQRQILVVDDDLSMCELVAGALRRRGMDAEHRPSPQEAMQLLRHKSFDLVITDLQMKGASGVELCEWIALHRADMPVLVVTAYGSLETAITAIRAGAWDYVTKPFDFDALLLAVERALKQRALAIEASSLRDEVQRARAPTKMLGESLAIQRVVDLVARAAETDATVLIHGESGTGKELVARALHEGSKRHAAPFIAVNCAAMPETLLESELFGHAKGAFTDAKEAKVGLFVQASGGTLFLDEVGEMPLQMQTKLLRALQERTVRPVGGSAEVPFDVRLVTATNRMLESEIEDKRFREDLFFRINVLRVDLPPLRSRGDDVLLLARKFLEKFSVKNRAPVTGISADAAARLRAYDWPGNVRELENCIECAVAMTRNAELGLDDLPRKVLDHVPAVPLAGPIEAAVLPTELTTMDEVERRYIAQVLVALRGNKSQAATVLGFDRRTLYRKLERYALLDA
jgi:two-component system, NtrC family, response regulator AtoC